MANFNLHEWMTTDELAKALDDALGWNQFENIRDTLIRNQESGTGLPFTVIDGAVLYSGDKVAKWFTERVHNKPID